ncbi:MAG: hypothetical protein L3J93_05370 [Thermoplasmata archaeon]|nr:hypothetical protein [Thermoplasmata archaeon]
MTSILPPVTPALLPFGLLFGLMLLGNSWVLVRLLPRRGGAPTLATATFAVGLLLMAAGLWGALIFAVVDPGDASTVSVFLAVNSMMAVVGLWALSLFWGAEERRLPTKGWLWPLLLSILIVGNEVLMGAAFTLALLGLPSASGGAVAQVASVTSRAIVSVWFFGAMFANMLLVALWLPVERAIRAPLAGIALSAAVGPWVVSDPLVGAALMGLLMGGLLVVGLRALRSRTASPAFVRSVLVAWIGVAGMGVGALLDGIPSGERLAPGLPYALASLLVMIGEFVVLARWGLAASGAIGAPTPLQSESSGESAASASP